VALDELTSESAIGLGGSASGSVFQDRLPKTRRFAQAHAARDYGFVNTFAEVLPHIGNYLLTKVGSRVEHCHNNPTQLETLVCA